MVFQAAIDSLADALRQHAWAGELAGILPLPVLIDFVEIPPKLHILELAGAVPLWSWGITPSGSRLLLANDEIFASRGCYLDRFGKTVALEALDGFYGERYFASSSETLRLILDAHGNMEGDGFDRRIQYLHVVHISRRKNGSVTPAPSNSLASQLLEPWRTESLRYLATDILGWIFLIGMLLMSAFFQTWISFAFILLNPVAGILVTCQYGMRPRRLLVEKPSSYVRLLVVTEQMNSTDWVVLYGESTLVNSLINRPLEPTGPPPLSTTTAKVCCQLLQMITLGQWGLALAAASTKDWNAYFVCFWITFSIFTHAYLIPPTARDWSNFRANLKADRYTSQLSSRCALLNTIIALNPDTFRFDQAANAPDMTSFNRQGMKGGWTRS